MSEAPSADLLFRLRSPDSETKERALAEAYAQVFNTAPGRYVLAAILGEAGLARARGPDLGPEARAYHDGRMDMAVTIMNRAGFDQASAAVTVLTLSDEMKGRNDERDEQRYGRADPGAEWLDD